MNYKKLSRIADSSSMELGIEPFVATLLRLKNEFFETFPEIAEAADNGDVEVKLDVENINWFEISLHFILTPSSITTGEEVYDDSSISQLSDHFFDLEFGNTINVNCCRLTVYNTYANDSIYSNYDCLYDVFPDSTDEINVSHL